MTHSHISRHNIAMDAGTLTMRDAPDGLMIYCRRMERICGCGGPSLYARDGRVRYSGDMLACLSDEEIEGMLQLLQQERLRRSTPERRERVHGTA